MRRLLVRLLVLALPLTALASCGGDDPAPAGNGISAEAPAAVTAPAEYMEGLCAAIVSFQTDLEAENTTFQEQFAGGTPSPEDTKAALGTFLGTLSDRTTQLVDEVDALGTPDAENGDEVRSALTSAFEQVVDLFSEARTEIEGLSIEDPAALAEGFAAAATKLQEGASGITAPLDDLASPELDGAAADAPSCEGVV